MSAIEYIKCDMCRAVSPTPAKEWGFYDRDRHADAVRLDLCPECAAKVEELLEKEMEKLDESRV